MLRCATHLPPILIDLTRAGRGSEANDAVGRIGTTTGLIGTVTDTETEVGHGTEAVPAFALTTKLGHGVADHTIDAWVL